MRRRRRRRRICLGEISGHDEDEDARTRGAEDEARRDPDSGFP